MNEEMLKKRLVELSARADARGRWMYTEFLTLAEQDILSRLRLSAPYLLLGGTDVAERRVAAFGSVELCGYEPEAPICCLELAPTAQKFSDDLSHRDFLGSLMALGVRREVLGDIIIYENKGYVFCLDSISDYISEQLTQVRRTTVSVHPAEDLPPALTTLPEISVLVVASERLDALVSAVYKLSRSESSRLFDQERVFVNSRVAKSSSAMPASGDIVSVRGQGRFKYDGISTQTRKGKLRVELRIY